MAFKGPFQPQIFCVSIILSWSKSWSMYQDFGGCDSGSKLFANGIQQNEELIGCGIISVPHLGSEHPLLCLRTAGSCLLFPASGCFPHQPWGRFGALVVLLCTMLLRFWGVLATLMDAEFCGADQRKRAALLPGEIGRGWLV